MDANQNLTAEMIKIDPYNYTLSEMVDVIGETEAKKLLRSQCRITRLMAALPPFKQKSCGIPISIPQQKTFANSYRTNV